MLRLAARHCSVAVAGAFGSTSLALCAPEKQWGWRSAIPGLRGPQTLQHGAEKIVVDGPLIPLSRRYLGTRIERSPRAQLLMGDAEVEACARLINDLVDLAFFDEEDEQEIFEFCVCHVAEVLSLRLPNRFLCVIHSSREMPASDALDIEHNICEWVFDYVELPFLDVLDRRCVVRCVVKLMTRSMTMASTPVGGAMTDEEHTRIVTEIFLKSIDHRFTDLEEREKLVNSFAAYAEKIPLVPGNVVATICDKLVSAIAENVQAALTSSYQLCNAAMLEGRDLRALAKQESDAACHACDDAAIQQRPFEVVFRSHLAREMLDLKAFPFNCLPGPMHRSASLTFMEEVLTMIETEKLEAVFADSAAQK